jgi:energy-converting hydrogenase Eha subunit E
MISRTLVVRIQGTYYLLTGLWPLVHMTSFEAVTGPKTDDWLVHMVGLLAATIGAALVTAARQWRGALETIVLAVGSAMAFIAVDVWYVLRGQISGIYLADAAVEIVLVALLLSRGRAA